MNLDKNLGNNSAYKLEQLYEDFIPGKVYTKFCKYIIGANKHSKYSKPRVKLQLMHSC